MDFKDFASHRLRILPIFVGYRGSNMCVNETEKIFLGVVSIINSVGAVRFYHFILKMDAHFYHWKASTFTHLFSVGLEEKQWTLLLDDLYICFVWSVYARSVYIFQSNHLVSYDGSSVGILHTSLKAWARRQRVSKRLFTLV